MRLLPFISLASALALFAAPALGAQEPATSILSQVPQGALDAARNQLLLDEPGDGTVQARGSNWKASFGDGGFEYTPFLGSDAPRNFPVQLALSGVTLGGEQLSLAVPGTPELQGSSVTMDRAALREVYHLDYETVEQTFVFDALPAAGPMRLSIDVTTDLEMQSFEGGWSFFHERGHVVYGSATAIDADGRRLGLEQVRTPSGFEIVVPEDFVQSAALPLVVDPILSTFMVTDGNVNRIDADVAYDEINGVYMIVYEELFSLFDHDVVSVFYSPSIGTVNGVSGIDISSQRWDDPRIASCYFRETFLCVAVRGTIIGSREVWGRTRSAQTGSRGPKFEISSGVGDHSHADVGGYGNDVASPYSFVVVWQRSGNAAQTQPDIVTQGVSHTSGLTGGVRSIANVNGQADRHPSISQSSGTPGLNSSQHEYMIVWERVVAPGNRDIWARVIERDNTTTGHPRYRAYSFSDALDPDVSAQQRGTLSSGPIYVIVFERRVGSDYDIFAVVASNGDADNARNISVMQDVAVQDEQADPHVAFEGDDYLISYASEGASGGFDVYYTALNVVSDGNENRTGLSERRESFRVPDGSLRSNAITASGLTGSGSAEGGLAVWVANGSSGTDGDVGAAVVENQLRSVVGSQYCGANANSTGSSAWITAVKTSQVPSGDLQLRVSDLPPGEFGIFVTSQGNGVTPNAGGSAGNLCVSGAIGRFNASVGMSSVNGTRNHFIGLGSLPTPTGTTSAQIGETWNFQYWTRDMVNGSATSNYSNAIAVSFI